MPRFTPLQILQLPPSMVKRADFLDSISSWIDENPELAYSLLGGGLGALGGGLITRNLQGTLLGALLGGGSGYALSKLRASTPTQSGGGSAQQSSGQTPPKPRVPMLNRDEKQGGPIEKEKYITEADAMIQALHKKYKDKNAVGSPEYMQEMYNMTNFLYRNGGIPRESYRHPAAVKVLQKFEEDRAQFERNIQEQKEKNQKDIEYNKSRAAVNNDKAYDINLGSVKPQYYKAEDQRYFREATNEHERDTTYNENMEALKRKHQAVEYRDKRK